MRAIVQRVSAASVTVDGAIVGAIDRGLLILLGVAHGDAESDGEWLAQKIAALRIFEDDTGKMNRSLVDLGALLGSQLSTLSPQLLRPTALVVSQFTLLASTAKGTRPSFNAAAPPALAIPLYEKFIAQLSVALGGRPCATGRFGAMMQVALVNDGPVTIAIDSRVRE